MSKYLSDIILRQEAYPPATTKGSTLTWKELDDDLIAFMQEFQLIYVLPNVASYNGTTIYRQGDIVTYDSKLWKYINAAKASGHTPAEDIWWTQVGIGELFAHTNTDTFVNGDLAGGDLTIDHNLGTTMPTVVVKNNAGLLVNVQILVDTSNRITLKNLGTITGTWTFAVKY